MIVRWPGRVEPGSITHQLGHVIDFMPTLLEPAGGKYPHELDGNDNLPVEGKSLVPAFLGRRRDGHKSLGRENDERSMSGDTLRLEPKRQLLSMDGNLLRCIEANAHAASLDLQDLNRDGFAIEFDHHSLTALSGQD